jgi:autotransporter translocation and assembly factor TamB
VIVIAVGGLLALVTVGIVAASVVLQGPRLARIIQGALPESRGKLSFGGVEWSLRALFDIITDAPSPIAVDGLRIIDPEGTIVLDVPHLDAKIKLRTLIAGSFSIHDLKVGKATWRFAQMQKTPEIGFVAALAPKTPPPPPKAGVKSGADAKGTFFQIASSELADLNAIFDFPGVWGLELRHIHASASLIQSAVDPKHPVFGFDVAPLVAEGGGWLRILDDNLLPFDRVAINRIATTADRPDDILLDLREARTGRTSFIAKGYFTGIYGETSTPGIALHAEFHDATDAFNQVVAGKKIDGLELSGDDATAILDLTKPFAQIQVTSRFFGWDVRYASYRALGVKFKLAFDGAAMAVAVDELSLKAPGGGALDVAAKLDIPKLRLGADVMLKRFTTDSYLPAALRVLAGGTVDGRLHASAELGGGGPSVAVRGLELRLNRRRGGDLPRSISARGAASWARGTAHTSGLTVEIDGARAIATGDVQLTRQVVALGLDLVAFDLARVMQSFGLPAVGQTAELHAEVDGPIASPHAGGTLKLTGLGLGKRRLPELDARFGLDRGTARLYSLSGEAFGGHLDASGSVRLFARSTRRPLESPELDARLSLRNIDLAQALGEGVGQGSGQGPGGWLAGQMSLSARITGPVSDPEAEVEIPAGQPVVLASQALSFGPAKLSFQHHRLTIHELRLARAGGGRLSLSGSATQDGALDLDLDLQGMNIAELPGVAAAGIVVTGVLGAKLHVAGTVTTPRIAGSIHLDDVVARGIPLGHGVIEISPIEPAAPGPGGEGVALLAKGELFDRFHLDVRLLQRTRGVPGFAVHGSVDFTKLMLESLLPELVALGEGRGLASGHVQIDIEPGQPLAADVLVTELWVVLVRAIDAGPGEPTSHRVEVSATAPIHVTLRGEHLVLDDMRLATTGGALHARGELNGREVAGNVDGHLDLELLQPFVRSRIERISGDLDLSLVASGTLDQPLLRGQLNIRDPIHIRPLGFDTDVIIASGTVSLSPELAALSRLRVTIDGPTMQIDGKVKLGPGFQPRDVDAHVAGEISARLLALVAGEAVSDAKGRARIKADVKGPLGDPTLTAWLGLGSITFRLRDTGNEIEVKSGVVEVSNSGALLRDVRVVIDDQGKLSIGSAGVRPGQVEFLSLVPLKLGRIDFPLHGEQLVYRSPGSFEINDLALDVNLGGTLDDGFAIGGEVRIISGRYTQDFVLSNLVLRPRTNESALHPFYEGKPLLAELALDLTVRTVGDAFVVQNNIAPEIHIDVALHVGGTLSQPELAGDVRPTDGRFQIPVLRGYFDLVPNVNHITFVETKSVADGDSPEIFVEAQNPVVDSAGIEHIVRMNIHGPLREMQIDLSTTDGLDRSQTALLLLTGRTTTTSDRFNTQNPTVGANLNTGLDIAGQATRDTIANLMEPIIGDTFEKAVGLQLRLTVGPDGFEGRLRKQINRVFRLQADSLFGFQGQSRWNVQGEMWLIDYVSLTGGWQRQTLTLQPGLSESLPINGSLELRWDFPFRM